VLGDFAFAGHGLHLEFVSIAGWLAAFFFLCCLLDDFEFNRLSAGFSSGIES
jgi:hypothetical protein